MDELLHKHYNKIINVINSCETHQHLISSKRMIGCFIKYWYFNKDKLTVKGRESFNNKLAYIRLVYTYKYRVIIIEI
jgi:hypothetical protein